MGLQATCANLEGARQLDCSWNGPRSIPCNVPMLQGDSGGPLLWKSPGGPAGDVAVGVVSWGHGCADKTPGVYSDVAFASQWIQNTIQVRLAVVVCRGMVEELLPLLASPLSARGWRA